MIAATMESERALVWTAAGSTRCNRDMHLPRQILPVRPSYLRWTPFRPSTWRWDCGHRLVELGIPPVKSWYDWWTRTARYIAQSRADGQPDPVQLAPMLDAERNGVDLRNIALFFGGLHDPGAAAAGAAGARFVELRVFCVAASLDRARFFAIGSITHEA